MENNINVERVANNLRSARVRAGYNQADVAKLLGVSRQTVNNFETDPGSLNIRKLVDLAKLYGCHLSYFFEA